MPDQYNYIVEVLIWNDNTIVERGEGYIRLRPIVEVKGKNTIKAREIQTSEFENVVEPEMIPEEEYRDKKGATPGFSLSLSAILLGSVAILRRRFA
jgi:hypothetical protein